jgi:hypothetical protein
LYSNRLNFLLRHISAFCTQIKEQKVNEKHACGFYRHLKTEKQAVTGISPETKREVKGKIVEFAWWLKKNGYRESMSGEYLEP